MLRLFQFVLAFVLGINAAAAKADLFAVPIADGFIGNFIDPVPDETVSQVVDDIAIFSDHGIDAVLYFLDEPLKHLLVGDDIATGVLVISDGPDSVSIIGYIEYQIFNRSTATSGMEIYGFTPARPYDFRVASHNISTNTLIGLSPVNGRSFDQIAINSTGSIGIVSGDIVEVDPATEDLQTELAAYYQTNLRNRPQGPIVIDNLVTAEDRPTITGRLTTSSEMIDFYLTLGGRRYDLRDGIDGDYDGTTFEWTLTPDLGSLIPGLIYDISAEVYNEDGWLLVDRTANDLQIVNPGEAAPQLTIEAAVDESSLSDGGQIGDQLLYSATISNTGLVPLTLEAASLDIFGPIAMFNEPADTYLLPGESTTAFLTYDLTADSFYAGIFGGQVRVDASWDIGNGSVQEDAFFAVNDGPAYNIGLELESSVLPTFEPSLFLTYLWTYLPQNPELEVRLPDPALDDVDNSGKVSAGDTLTITMLAENIGNIDLSNPVVTQTTERFDNTTLDLTAGDPSFTSGVSDDLQVETYASYTYTHTLTQEDIDTGGVTHTASVSAEYSLWGGSWEIVQRIVTHEADITVEFPAAPSLEVTNSVVATASPADVGTVLTYTTTVENTGNVTLADLATTQTFMLDDTTASQTVLTAEAFSAGDADSFPPGAVATYTTVYTVTDDDMLSDQLIQSISISAEAPQGSPSDDNDDVTAAPDPLITNLRAVPQISLVKSAVVNDVDGTRGTTVGDTATYTFSVKNTGNVTLTDITLTDPLLGGAFAETIASLAPGEVDDTTFAADYTLTRADLDNGSVSNSATVEATYSDGTLTDVSGTGYDTDDATVTYLGTIVGRVQRSRSGQSGVEVELLDGSGQVVGTTTTDSEGYYTFLQLEAGTYSVRFDADGARIYTGSGTDGTISGVEVAYGADRVIEQVDAYLVDPSGVVYNAISRQPIQGATVTLMHDGDVVPDSWLDTDMGDANNKVTGADGLYVYLLKSPAQTGTYSLSVEHEDYTFSSAIVPPQTGSYTPGMGAGIEEIAPTTDAPATGGDTTYYLAFDFTFGDWTDIDTLSKGVLQNHIPLDPSEYDVGLKVTMTADTTDVSDPPEAGQDIGYIVTVENTGDVPYGGLSVADTLGTQIALIAEVGVTDDARLDAGEAWTYAASYTVTATDLRVGEVMNLATLTANLEAGNYLNGGVSTTGEIGGEWIVESSPDGNTARGTGNGTATIVDLVYLLEQIEDDLTSILRDDLRNTMRMQSTRFAGFARDAAHRLRNGTGEEPTCGDQIEDTVSGSAEADTTGARIDFNHHDEQYDCGKSRWIIDDVSLDLTHDVDVGTQYMLQFSRRWEKQTETAVTGHFVGGYHSRTTVSSLADGDITGFGLNAGLYGARYLTQDIVGEYYLAGSFGRHNFDLVFMRNAPIRATGSYDYFGAFAGGAISGEWQQGDTIYAPRLGIDAYYTPGATASVHATSGQVQEDGSVKIDPITGLRISVGVDVMNDLSLAFDGAGMWDNFGGEFNVGAGAFCDIDDGADPECGIAAHFDWSRYDAERDRSHSLGLAYEKTRSREAMSFDISRTRYLPKDLGEDTTTISVGATGAVQVSRSLTMQF